MSFDDLHFYATYEDAVGRSCLKNQFSSSKSNEGNEASLRPPAQILIYTYTSVISLLLSMLRISMAIFQPFFIVFGAVIAVLMSLIIQWRSQQDSNNSVTFMYLFSNKVINYSPEVTIAAIIVSILFILLKSIFVSDSHDIPRKPEGSAIKAGLYYRREETSSSAQIVITSTLLKSACVIRSGLPGLPSTPWMLSGDLRTLFPYVFFRPVDVRSRYVRRWVRVHLADRDAEREQALKKANVYFEAVAVDHSPSTAPENRPGAAVRALLVLAGLTGGSSEGYVMDLVQHANQQGFDCFVMIGRGLAGCPLKSGVPFHGARTEDVVTVGQVIRSFLPPGSKLFAVGLSLGGIIVSSAMAKGPRDPDLPRLAQVVDGAVSISGCFDSMSNSAFNHSREVWQPMLAHGLKEAIVSNELYSAAMIRAFGRNGEDTQATYERVTRITEQIRSVVDFDSIMVTRLNGFRSVAEYYHHLTATDPQILASPCNCLQGGSLTLEKPLLAMHAMDDVIIHPNTMPSAAVSSSVDNLICLVTDTRGHVGWPVGLFPTKHRWLFQNSVAMDFCQTLCALQDKSR